MKVIPKEECVKQHHMLVCEFTAHIAPLTLHLSLEAQGPSQFQSAFKVKTMIAAAAVASAAGADVDSVNCVVLAWSKLNGPLLDAVTEVCGLSKNHQWKSETWWWNEEVNKAIQKKRARFKAYSALKKGGMTAEAKRTKPVYIDAKRMAKRAVWLAKFEAEIEEFATVSPDGDDVFCIAKQMDHTPECCWWELRTQWCWWAFAHLRRQDEGMGWALCYAAQCRIWVAKQQAPWSPSNSSWSLVLALMSSINQVPLCGLR